MFISADSYRGEYSNPLSQNRYTYAHNNPYKYDDPTGHLPASGINKYAANALMDAGSGTSSKTTVKPLPKKTPANVTTDDYRATNIDEAHARNQQNAFTGSFTLLGSTNKAPVKDTVVPKEESKATGEQESESIGTVTTIVTEHDNTQPNGVETYETQNTETKVIDIKDVTKAIISGAVMAGIGMAVMGLFAAASIAAPIAAVAAAAVSGFSQSFVDANVGALVENKTLEEYGKSQGYATLAEYQNKLFHDPAIGAVVGAVLATAFVFGSGLIKNSITKMVGQEAAEHADETLVILSESAEKVDDIDDEFARLAPEKVKDVTSEAAEKSSKTAQQGIVGDSSNFVESTYKSQYDIPINEKGYTKSNLELGKKVHKEYMSNVADDVNKIKEYALPSGKRVDFIDFENKVVYELKPNNPNQIKKGTKQLAGYLEEIETVFGKGWSSVLDTY